MNKMPIHIEGVGWLRVEMLGAGLVERDIIYIKLACMDGWSSTFPKTTFENIQYQLSLQNLKPLSGLIEIK